MEFINRFINKSINVIELILFKLSFINISYKQVSSRTTGNFSLGDKLPINEEYIDIHEKVVVVMREEYIQRKDSSLAKVNALFKSITFVLTIIIAIFSYINSNKFMMLDFFIILSSIFMFFSIFMILIYYKVSTVNNITFPKSYEHYNLKEYIKDSLICIGQNSNRLDFLVTAYKASFRYFLVSIISLIIGVVRQFSSVVYI